MIHSLFCQKLLRLYWTTPSFEGTIDISPSNNLIKLPNMRYHLNEIKPKNTTRKILKAEKIICFC